MDMRKLNFPFFICLFLMAFFHSKAFSQDGLIHDDFSSGAAFGWQTPTPGATTEVVNGQLEVSMALQSSGKYRGDLRKTEGATFHAGAYPIVAIRFNKPPRANLFFDTSLGSYNGRNNNHRVIATESGNIYYWDLSTGKLGATILSLEEPTTVSSFQFKVADVVLSEEEEASNNIKYEVDWVRTFSSLEALRSVAGAPNAEFEFTDGFVHPGLLHSSADLERIKGLVDEQVQRPFESYQKLLSSDKSSANYAMSGPFEYLSRQNGTVKNGVENDFMAAYYNALMWNITGEEAHAIKSIEIINAYAHHTIGIEGGDAELNGLYGFILANAAELMRHTYDGWAQTDIEQTEMMLKSVFYPVLGNFRPCAHGNWDHACMKALMAIAIFTEDREMLNKVINYFYHGEGNGSIENYVLTAAGQLQESNRDQPHTMLALGSLAEMAEMGLKQGIDLYGASNNAILRGYEYTSRYNLGYSVPYETSYDFCEYNYQDYSPEAISPKGRGQFRAVFEIAYNHYVYREGSDMPYTLEVLARMGPEGAPFGADNPGYGSLFFYLNEEEDHAYDDLPVDLTAGLIDDNFIDDSDGWIAATNGSTVAVDSGQLHVNMVLQPNGKYRGDIRKSGGAILYPRNYPILAIKIKKPTVSNLIFDTNLGSYGNGSNKWTGKVGEDVYYYDLTQVGFGSGAVFLSDSASTGLTTFQFKLADVTSGETAYAVDWIKTFEKVEDLLVYDPSAGLIEDDFTDGTDGWIANTDGSEVFSEEGILEVSLVEQANGTYRGDLRKEEGATLFSGNYPIVAIKIQKPEVSNLIFDTNLGAYGNGSNRWTGKLGQDIYYYDLRETGFGSEGTIIEVPTALSTFQFKVADITSGETSYTVDWVKSVQSVEDLYPFITKEEQVLTFNSLEEKKVGDYNYDAGAIASSGLPVSFSTSDESVAIIVEGQIHIVGPGSTTITASQEGNHLYEPAEAVTQFLSVIKLQHDPFQGEVAMVPGIVEAENYDEGGEGIAYHDLTGPNTGGAHRQEGVDIASSRDGGYHIGYIARGEWLKYTIRVMEDGEYILGISVASVPVTGKFKIEIEGEDVTGTIAVEPTGGQQQWATLSRKIRLKAGLRVMRIYVEGQNFNLDKFTFSRVEDLYSSSEAATGKVELEGKSFVDVLLYPNPVADQLHINFQEDPEEAAFVKIFDHNGTLVVSKSLTKSEETLQLNDFKAGIYLVKIWNGKDFNSSKIIKY